MLLNSNQFVFLLIGCMATCALLVIIFQQRRFTSQQFFCKRIITPFESKMFIRLKAAFPAHHVLAQVAFSALITHENLKVRSKFNRKVTDFVLLDDELNVVAVIELDDPSHIGKEAEDAQRDYMLQEAGYRVFRYKDIPTIKHLRKDILTR